MDKYWEDLDRKKREIGESSLNYIDFYKKFMDFRVSHDPYTAIGNLGWKKGGRCQFLFLKGEGLSPSHKVLDLGCGTLSLGNLLIPYLDVGNYTGTDISVDAIEAGVSIVGDVVQEREARLVHTKDFSFSELEDYKFDYIIAFSVFNHLPIKYFDEFCSGVTKVINKESRVFLTVIFSEVSEGVDTKPYSNFHYSKVDMEQILSLRNATMEILDTKEYGLEPHGYMNPKCLKMVNINWRSET